MLKISKKPLIVLVLVLFLMILVLLFNYKSIGKTPVVLSLSSSVVEPGDTISIIGQSFGGEISRGRVFINEKMVFKDFIQTWSDDIIILTLSEDFKSGMITVVNMFGESKPYLITSKNDVPTQKNVNSMLDLPYLDSAEYLDSSELFIKLSGSFLSLYDSKSLIKITGNNGYEFIVDSDSIINWSDEDIRFYIPFSISELSVVVEKNYGISNSMTLKKSFAQPIDYSIGESKKYSLKQIVEVQNIITLGKGSISLYMPCVLSDLNQSDISFYSEEGLFNKINNVYIYNYDFEETDSDIYTSLNTDVLVHKLDTKINVGTIGRFYDINSPEFDKGFIKTPNVSDRDIDIKNTGVWLVRNTSNRLEQVKILVDWILRYIKIDNSLTEDSSIGFKNRATSEYGIINIVTSMLRFVGIPTRIISGIKIDEDIINYRWIEFYIPSGGWVPFDIIRKKYDNKYTIGSLDNNLISFTKGVNNLSYGDNNFISGFYALQNNTSISSGNIESYDTIWHNIEIK